MLNFLCNFYDLNIQVGFGDFASTIDTEGERCSVSKAFLKPAMDRNNLTVITGAHVTKVLKTKLKGETTHLFFPPHVS